MSSPWEQDLSFVCCCFFACVLSHLSRVWLCDPVDHSPPGSSIHEILQQEYLSGLPCPPPGESSNPGIKPTLAGRLFTTGTTREAHGMNEWEDIKILTPGYLVSLPLQMKKSSAFSYKEETEKQLMQLYNASCFWSTELECDLFKWKLWGNCFGGIHKTNVIFTWRIHPTF